RVAFERDDLGTLLGDVAGERPAARADVEDPLAGADAQRAEEMTPLVREVVPRRPVDDLPAQLGRTGGAVVGCPEDGEDVVLGPIGIGDPGTDAPDGQRGRRHRYTLRRRCGCPGEGRWRPCWPVRTMLSTVTGSVA